MSQTQLEFGKSRAMGLAMACLLGLAACTGPTDQNSPPNIPDLQEEPPALVEVAQEPMLA